MSQPDWMNQENERASKQAGKGQTANPSAPRLVKPETKAKAPAKPKEERVLKGFRVTKDLVQQFELLVVEQKNSTGKNGPQLIDEALTLLLKKYGKA